jgi:hypothetical protein
MYKLSKIFFFFFMFNDKMTRRVIAALHVKENLNVRGIRKVYLKTTPNNIKSETKQTHQYKCFT